MQIFLPSTPALFPTKLPLRVILLSTVFKRTLKLGDRRALAAAEALAVAAGAAEVAVVAAASTAGFATFAAVPSDAAVEDAAAVLACLSVLAVEAEAIGIFRDRTQPSRRPQSPPAPRPASNYKLLSVIVMVDAAPAR
jgi:hypothetical protein